MKYDPAIPTFLATLGWAEDALTGEFDRRSLDVPNKNQPRLRVSRPKTRRGWDGDGDRFVLSAYNTKLPRTTIDTKHPLWQKHVFVFVTKATFALQELAATEEKARAWEKAEDLRLKRETSEALSHLNLTPLQVSDLDRLATMSVGHSGSGQAGKLVLELRYRPALEDGVFPVALRTAKILALTDFLRAEGWFLS